jgi:hypothetical protein
MLKAQSPLSVGGLRRQGVERFGRSEAFVSSLNQALFLLDQVHEFATGERPWGCVDRCAPQQRPGPPCEGSMILCHHVIEIFDLQMVIAVPCAAL